MGRLEWGAAGGRSRKVFQGGRGRGPPCRELDHGVGRLQVKTKGEVEAGKRGAGARISEDPAVGYLCMLLGE